MFVCTVSFHNFKSQKIKLSVSNPNNKYVAYVSVLSQISNCQGLGRKNNFEIMKTDRIVYGSASLSFIIFLLALCILCRVVQSRSNLGSFASQDRAVVVVVSLGTFLKSLRLLQSLQFVLYEQVKPREFHEPGLRRFCSRFIGNLFAAFAFCLKSFYSFFYTSRLNLGNFTSQD